MTVPVLLRAALKQEWIALETPAIRRIPEDLPRLSDFEGILNAQTLLPQIGPGGEVRALTQPEPNAEQMSLGVESGTI